MLTVVSQDVEGPAVAGEGGSLLDEIVRDRARRMLAAALEAEVDAYIEAHANQMGEDGRRPVVRNGHAQPRRVSTSAGAIEVRASRNRVRTRSLTAAAVLERVMPITQNLTFSTFTYLVGGWPVKRDWTVRARRNARIRTIVSSQVGSMR